jgi:branched-chain amino acid transport system ATP-binding protein
MLEIRNLYGGWGPTTIVEDVSLQLATGETVAIIGRNGVGKSTLLEIILGRAQWRAGMVLLDGVDIAQLPIYRRSELGIGYVPQEREVFPSLTIEENLFVAQRCGPWSRDLLMSLFPGLARRLKNLAGQLSGGEQQMLSIARALIGNPKVLIMDEPSEGLAPVIVEQVVDALRGVARAGSLTILLVEQRVDIALDLATRCAIMDRGRIVFEATSNDMRRQPDRLSQLIGLDEKV